MGTPCPICLNIDRCGISGTGTYVLCGPSNHVQSIIRWLDVHALEGVTDNINSLLQCLQIQPPSVTRTYKTLKAVPAEQCSFWSLQKRCETRSSERGRGTEHAERLVGEIRNEISLILMCVPGTPNFVATLGTRRESSQPCRMNEAFQTRAVLSWPSLCSGTQYTQLNLVSAVIVGWLAQATNNPGQDAWMILLNNTT